DSARSSGARGTGTATAAVARLLRARAEFAGQHVGKVVHLKRFGLRGEGVQRCLRQVDARHTVGTQPLEFGNDRFEVLAQTRRHSTAHLSATAPTAQPENSPRRAKPRRLPFKPAPAQPHRTAPPYCPALWLPSAHRLPPN